MALNCAQRQSLKVTSKLARARDELADRWVRRKAEFRRLASSCCCKRGRSSGVWLA